MGREVRMVPPDWQHPKNPLTGDFAPLLPDRFASALEEWENGAEQWAKGFRKDWSRDDKFIPIEAEHRHLTYEEWDGEKPLAEHYMPAWTPEVATHLMMYEDTSEGTPISPAFETPEELARWLVDNEATANGDRGASYEGWLRVARGGYAPSMVSDGRTWTTGVDSADVIPVKDA